MKSWHIAALLVLATYLSLPATAMAGGGFVAGQLTFTNRNGNFCPTVESCTGATYVQSQYNQETGIPEAMVMLFTAGGTLLAQTSTNASGVYIMPWNTGGTNNENAFLFIFYVQKNSRFDIRGVSNPAPTTPLSNFGSLVLTHGTTISTPQLYGGSVGVNQVANTYWAAWKEWQLLATSNRQLLYFTNVDILAFDTGNITGCHATGSCARPYFKNMSTGRPGWTSGQFMTIVLDGNAPTPFSPETRVMHEMGHVADFVSAPSAGQGRVLQTGYDRDGDSTWSWPSVEYTPTAMTEGFATFIANAAFYNGGMANPRVCEANGNGFPSQLHCWAGIFQESIEFGPGSCPSQEGRRALASMRFFRDVFDSTNDSNDTLSFAPFQMFDAVAAVSCPSYPACYGNGQLHDSWTSVDAQANWDTAVRGAGSERDKNGPDWFRNVMNSGWSTNLNNIYNQNCMGSL